ncbi:MAG: hypothetical protein DRN66_02995, partial [Candidatus Nanohalarchaeota archaeon]
KEKNYIRSKKKGELKKKKKNYEKNMTEKLEQFEKKIKLKMIKVNKLNKILDEKTKIGTILADELTALENPKGNFISRNEFEKANLNLSSSIDGKIKSLEKEKDKLDKKLDSELKEQTKNGKKIAKKMDLIESAFIARSRAIDELDRNVNEKFKQIENDIALRDELQKPNISLQKTMIEEKIKNAVEKIRIESGSDIEKKIADMKGSITAEMKKNIGSVNSKSIDLINKKISQLNDKVNALGLIQNKISGIEDALDAVNKKTNKFIGELPEKKIASDELNFIQKTMDEKISDMESRFMALESAQSKSREIEKQIKTSGISRDDLSNLEKMISSETKKYAEQAFLESNAKLQKQIGGMKDDIIREMNETIESINLMSLGLMKDKVNELQVLINEKTKKCLDPPGSIIIE